MIAEEQLTEWEREAADGELRRQSAHALIAEVRRLQGELATVQVAAHAVIDTVTAERDAMRAVVDAAREAASAFGDEYPARIDPIVEALAKLDAVKP